MKRTLCLFAIVLFVGIPFSLSADAYDQSFAVQNMRNNVARISIVKNAVAANDFHAAGAAFFAYGDDAATMQKMDPPKGSKEEWVKLWSSFQDVAFRGVGACGERDAEKTLKILDELAAFSKTGHMSFR